MHEELGCITHTHTHTHTHTPVDLILYAEAFFCIKRSFPSHALYVLDIEHYLHGQSLCLLSLAGKNMA
jgi:hypothetical protein